MERGITITVKIKDLGLEELEELKNYIREKLEEKYGEFNVDIEFESIFN